MIMGISDRRNIMKTEETKKEGFKKSPYVITIDFSDIYDDFDDDDQDILLDILGLNEEEL